MHTPDASFGSGYSPAQGVSESWCSRTPPTGEPQELPLRPRLPFTPGGTAGLQDSLSTHGTPAAGAACLGCGSTYAIGRSPRRLGGPRHTEIWLTRYQHCLAYDETEIVTGKAHAAPGDGRTVWVRTA